ncbi:hypothetical protein LEP1GSC021_2620 [Leptospira noguchii str. 1993005606]|nr:hypothetical protein LEP1GSC021_2620 [Leptospira noguchii str. 1993005606]
MFGKVIISIQDVSLVNQIEIETIPIPEDKEPQKYKYPPRDLLEGIDLEKVKTKLNRF